MPITLSRHPHPRVETSEVDEPAQGRRGLLDNQPAHTLELRDPIFIRARVVVFFRRNHHDLSAGARDSIGESRTRVFPIRKQHPRALDPAVGVLPRVSVNSPPPEIVEPVVGCPPGGAPQRIASRPPQPKSCHLNQGEAGLIEQGDVGCQLGRNRRRTVVNFDVSPDRAAGGEQADPLDADREIDVRDDALARQGRAEQLQTRIERRRMHDVLAVDRRGLRRADQSERFAVASPHLRKTLEGRTVADAAAFVVAIQLLY